MKCYPIGIPTLNRIDHLKRCIQSLQCNSCAQETELVIGIDFPPLDKYVEGHNRILEYVDTIGGFRKITVFRHKSNLGPSRNWQFIQDYIFRENDAAIMTEDDNEFAPCFLEYINTCLEKFKDNPLVAGIGGYTPSSFETPEEKNLILSYDNSAWGVGRWKNKEQLFDEIPNDYYFNILANFRKSYKIFKVYPALLDMLMSCTNSNKIFGDTRRTCLNIMNHTYQMKPFVSLVRNWGYDGSGINCNNVNHSIFTEQKILEQSAYPFVDGKQEFCYVRNLRNLGLSQNKIHRFLSIARIAVSYFLYRIFKRYIVFK